MNTNLKILIEKIAEQTAKDLNAVYMRTGQTLDIRTLAQATCNVLMLKTNNTSLEFHDELMALAIPVVKKYIK